MATSSDARAVKSLNKSSGRRRFVFKTFSQRIEDIDIDVYRSLDLLKAEPSQGSSFFRDCLVEYRELNTAEDFIAFYEETFPLVQTLPQIILQKDVIISSLVSRLNMEGRLSHEPILRLLSALSRDLLEDFIPFLDRIADSLQCLLESGADRDPEIIEQIFTSWSYIMMYLQKYLAKDVGHVLRITAKLRYYPKDYVREFMAESVSFLLRKTPVQQLKKGITKLMAEVVEESSELRKSGVGALLSHVMRITSSRLHSKSETLLPLLMGDSSFQIGDQSVEGSSAILEVLTQAFQRLYEELDPGELASIWSCLREKITECVTKGNSVHLSRLLTLLISIVQNDYPGKKFDYRAMVELLGLLVQTFVIPFLSMEIVEQQSEVIDKVLQLMLCIINGLSSSNNMPDLLHVSEQWKPVFDLRSRSLLPFIKDLLMKDLSIVHVFATHIIRVFDNLIQISDEEVLHLMINFCEKIEGGRSSFVDGKSKEQTSRIHAFFQDTLNYWIENITESVTFQIQQNKLAVLWGVVRCYSHFPNAQVKQSRLMDLINAMDELLAPESRFPKHTWQSIIGAALRSYHKLVFTENIVHIESSMAKFLDLAKRCSASPQILSAVADILDSISVSSVLQDTRSKVHVSKYVAGKVSDALDIFAENLCHGNRQIRVSTLRILCHYEPKSYEHAKREPPIENSMRTDASETSHVDDCNSVLDLLLSIEETALSIATSRKVILLISKIQMSLSAHRVADRYIPVVLNGIVGIFHNRFSSLWIPASECLNTLIGQYFSLVWERYVKYLDHCQSVFLTSREQHDGHDNDPNEETGLVRRFNSDMFPVFDSTPRATILSLLIQSLQKVPSLAESHSQQIIDLFLNFLGYNEKSSNVASYTLDYEGKDWKGVLKDWLSLFRLFRNPKASYRSQFFRNVLEHRLLDQNDADIQMKVLDCLLNWGDDFLLPYSGNLKNLINSKTLRDELTKWSLSKTSNDSIDVRHRAYVVPIVIRTLIPKVRNLKMLACQKNASVHHRRAVIGFLSQLDVDELPLFFGLLIRPLLSASQKDDETSKNFPSSSESPTDEFDTSNILQHFTTDTIKALSWKKRYGFLHVIEDILAVFDESHLNPFLDLLMNCVVRILASCTLSLGCMRSNESPSHDEVENQMAEKMDVKQFKDMRSLCIKIIYLVLSRHEDHDFDGIFWDLFFTSIKPLIVNFKQEGASSKKPSSLFHCFLAMSKSYKLVPLLYQEKTLAPDIFSILTVPSASESVLSCVLKFTKNLLKLDSELDSEDVSVKRILLPHLNVLLCSLHSIFTNDNSSKRQFVKFPGKREFTIFNLLSKYVKEPLAAKTFVDILLPLLTKKHQNLDTCIEVLQIIHQVVGVLGSESSKQILNSITPLLISADLAVRITICDVIDAVAVNDSSVLILAKILRELNATSEMEIGALDYDKVLCAYDKVNMNFFYSIREEHALPILAHSVHDMSSDEMILRQSAFRLLLSFIEFSGEILNGHSKSDQMWSEASIQHIINNFFLKHMGSTMDKECTVKKVWLDLLREMVLKIPKVANLGSYRALCSDDAEQDFFNNIVHLQKHRRARALSRFKSIISSGNLSEVITNKVFVPLLFSMLFDLQDGKDEHIRSACMDAMAAISGCMKWNRYYALLTRCFRNLTLKPDKQKILLRLICSILDHFHFSGASSIHEANVSVCDAPDPYTIETTGSSTLKKLTTSAELPMIQTCLHKNLLPKIQKLLTADSDKINVNVSLVALKLLKLLPAEIMDSQLPSIVHRISNFLKNRLDSVRDEARSALAACLKELGLEYLQFIVKVLKGTLKRGYELHVLGYTLNFMLSKFLMNPICGKLDYCLQDLLSIVENDILGGVSEEKEVDKIASKMKETRKQKSYETLKLIAQSVTFKTHALKLLSPVTAHLNKHLSQKEKSKLENMLNHIAAGIEGNPSVDQTEIFVFVNCLIKDGISDESNENGHSYISRESNLDGEDHGVHTIPGNRLVKVDGRFSYLVTAFALGVLQNYMKKLKLNREDEQLLSLLDPFVSLLGQCLSSKYDNIITAALRCLSLLVRLPLPSLQSQADKIKNLLLGIAEGSVNTSSELTESCIKLLTTLLRSTRVTLSSDQLHMLIQFPLFVDFAKNPSFVALSLLKAIVQRKLVVPEIYDVVQIVAELMVQSQLEPIRKKCSEILLQFLLGYHLSEKRLQQHLDFLLANLRYEHPSGRESVLEMLRTIILKFPRNIVDAQSQTMFVHLVISLSNDDVSKVRSMTAAALKCLIGHVSTDSRDSILEYSLSWYLGGKQNLWSAAAQVLGLLVEVLGKKFEKHLNRVLPVMRSILQSAVSAQQNVSDEEGAPFWKEAYYSLVMLEKILFQFPNFFFESDIEDIWETICGFLLHPHPWLRKISNRILSFYFAAVTNARDKQPKETFFLMKPSMLFLTAVSFCCQLKVRSADDTAGIVILKNLEFSILGLHSFFRENECMVVSKFWSNLECTEQDRFVKAFGIIDPRKGRRMLTSFTSDATADYSQHQHPFVSYLLQRMAKMSFQMNTNQMKIVFTCFKSIARGLLDCGGEFSAMGSDDQHRYEYQLLLPLYRVVEGYTGQVISDDLKQLAQEVSESIRDIIGMQNFVQIYSQIRKNLKVKREKRKQGEKVMAVVNPVRNAKRKLRIAAKHQAHKKRKMMTMKMGRWMH